MRYIMPFTCLKDELIQKNTTKLLQMFLNKMGYANSTSRAVIYGPIDMGGMALYDLELEIGIGQIERMIHGMNEKQQLGQLTRATLRNWFFTLQNASHQSKT